MAVDSFCDSHTGTVNTLMHLLRCQSDLTF